MKSFLKKALLLGLAAVTGAFCLNGCVPGDSTTLATVGSETVSYGVANLYVRYMQASYENYYAYMGTDTDTMWSQSYTTSTTLEDTMKSSLKDSIITLYVLDQNKDAYSISLTEDEENSISDAADAFIAANDKETLKVMSGTKENMVKLLELLTVQSKMQTAIAAEADTNVTDEEAAQKKMLYVKFSYSTDSTSSTDSSDTTDTDAAKAAAKASAESFRDGVTGETDFDAYATAQGYTSQSATFDSTSTTPNVDLVAAASSLSEGGTTEVIGSESDSSFYVARLVSTFDREATDTKKESIVSERKSDHYNETYTAMKDALTIDWKDKVWSKLSLQDQGVTVKSSSSSSSSSTGETSKTLSTDTSLTVADGNTVNIDYVGTIDGVEFSGGTAQGRDLTIGSGAFVSGFEDQLIGHKAGETVEVNVTFPDNYSDTSLQGKDAVFSVTINGIYE